MAPHDAYKILRSEWGNVSAHKCVECKTIFIFALGTGSDSLLGAASVDKKTGVVQKFMPVDISIEEYRAGVEIKNFGQHHA